MKRFPRAAGLFALAFTLTLAAVVAIAPADAFAATLSPAFHAASGLDAHRLFDGLLQAGPLAMAALRAQETDLVARAKAKLAEITDGLADDAVRSIEAEHGTLLAKLEEVRGEIRTLEAVVPAPGQTPPAPAPAAPGADAVRQAEAERCAVIADLGQRAGLPQAEIDAAIRNTGLTLDAFRTRACEAMATAMNALQTRSTGGGIVFGGQDETDTRRRAMSDALVFRLARANGERSAQLPDHARQYAETGLAELAAECIGHRGLIRTARQVTEVFERAFHSTSDFPGIFVDALNVRLLARYQTAKPTYRLFAALYTTTDFRPTHVVRAGDFPALQPVKQTGEIASGSFSESKEVFRVSPYAVSVNLSRQMIVNDHLGAIDQMLGSVGERVTDWENALAFEALKSNPVLLTDNKRMFSAEHKNLAAAGTGIDVKSVGLGRSAMMKQVTLDGMKANFTPKTLLVNPDDQTVAEQLFTAITPSAPGNAVPESFRRMLPASDANLDGDTAWYEFADPAIAPCFVYGYLEGFEGPRLTSEQVFGVQGMKVKLEHDFGVAGIDFRGGYKNPGVAPQ